MFLTSTGHSLELLLAGAVTTNQLHVTAHYGDHTSTAFTPGSSITVSNDTTPVTIVSAPAASTQRQVIYLSVFNNDTVDATVTIRINDGGTTRIIRKITLKTGETMEWNYDDGWSMITSGGLIKVTGVNHLIKDSCVLPVGFWTGSITGTKSIGSNFTYGVWLGRAERSYSSITLRYRVTTAAATITWAEIGIATGAVYFGSGGGTGGAQLTTRGFTDVSAIVNTTGIKSTAVSVSGINPGDDMWALIGNQATTPMLIRSSSNADNITSGRYVESNSGTRPSTMGGGTEFGVDGTVYGWIAATFT